MANICSFVALLFGYLCFTTNAISHCNGESNVGCIQSERLALLRFKAGLKDPHQLLSSWMGANCCAWTGVSCDNETGHVIAIDLRYHHLSNDHSTDWRLGGEIGSSLLDLKDLKHLDLSSNNFGGRTIPHYIGSMAELRYLNLSNAGFSGRIPHQLGNLSNLEYLDLNSFHSLYDLNADSIRWLSNLASLRYLDMTRVTLAKASDWFHAVNALPSLSVLHLPFCRLSNIPAAISHVNLSSLATLDLSNNEFDSRLPEWLFNISSLIELHLQVNHFHGSIPDVLNNMASLEVLQLGINDFVGSIPSTIKYLCNLRILDLSSNKIDGELMVFPEIFSGCVRESLEVLNLRSNKLKGKLAGWLGLLKRLIILDLSENLLYGPIPASIGELSALKTIFLDRNQLNGTLPVSIGQLRKLQLFDVSLNSLEGLLTEHHFVNLSRLEDLSLASNHFVLNISSEWVPPFQLRLIGLRSCQLGPKFPAWLQTQKDYWAMDLSHGGIADILPDWLWDLSHQIVLLDLSYNQLDGKVPASLRFASISILILSSNNFDGPLPPLPSSMEYLDLSNNSFSGDLLPIFAGEPLLLSNLFLSNNLINGTIPESICTASGLVAIDLSGNLLSGGLPQCWAEFPSLMVIDLSNNNLSGSIPSTMRSLTVLQALHLGNNSIYGELPESLKHCKSLVTLDLGGNRLSGMIPTWIGTLPFLKILRLRSNNFAGDIPSELAHLPSLQILDLAENGLSGSIPQSFGNFAAMVLAQKANESMLDSYQSSVQSSVDDYGPMGYIENLLVVIKGRELEYSKNLQYVTSIDISNNKLAGEIPPELMNLHGLHSLNMSANHLTGMIPDGIGGVRLLESLDLSRNNLTGPIPTSMSALTSLSHLNLSYNNLSGRIPSGYQLQTLDDPSIYMGNPELCGFPLDRTCLDNRTLNDQNVTCGDGDECGIEMLSFYIGTILGFVIGFWAICGPLLFNITWRRKYFQFIDRMNNRLMACVPRKI
uniref:Receptor-like protein EIX2 n=1 Tax=Elaeis guineensis var. tenera TaxID=51953 RepID=A0A6J0PBV8_ELAGV|nr:receptor-like protein EIX2 [Elaeis guineensis]